MSALRLIVVLHIQSEGNYFIIYKKTNKHASRVCEAELCLQREQHAGTIEVVSRQETVMREKETFLLT